MLQEQKHQVIDLRSASPEYDPATAWAHQVYDELADLTGQDVFFDVDLSIYDGEFCDLEFNPQLNESAGVLRPGTRELFSKLLANGNRIHLWSRRSKYHAAGVAQIYGLSDMISGCHNKGIVTGPDGRLAAVNDVLLSDVVRETGIVPAATIDNDPNDRIIDAPRVRFVEVDDFNARKRIAIPA